MENSYMRFQSEHENRPWIIGSFEYDRNQLDARPEEIQKEIIRQLSKKPSNVGYLTLKKI